MQANGVAGLQAVQLDGDRVENIDLTDIVSGNFILLSKKVEFSETLYFV